MSPEPLLGSFAGRGGVGLGSGPGDAEVDADHFGGLSLSVSRPAASTRAGALAAPLGLPDVRSFPPYPPPPAAD